MRVGCGRRLWPKRVTPAGLHRGDCYYCTLAYRANAIELMAELGRRSSQRSIDYMLDKFFERHHRRNHLFSIEEGLRDGLE